MVQSGQYLVKVTRNTGMGQTEVFSQSVTFLETPREMLGGVVIQPNPVLPGQTLKIVFPSGLPSGTKVEAKVYSLTGQLVAQGGNGQGSIQIVLPMEQAAPGIYLVRLSARDAGGRQSQRTLKVALVH
jgi:hypothetical protein